MKQLVSSHKVVAHLRRYPLNAADRKGVAEEDGQHKARVAAKRLHLSDVGIRKDETPREPVPWRWIRKSAKAYHTSWMFYLQHQDATVAVDSADHRERDDIR